MLSLDELKEQMSGERPVSWEQMPDIPLYMDQIVSYMPRQLIGLSEDKLTSAMVNNYIKDGILPRADGKKYSKDHIAYLTAICVLKQVISVRDIRTLLGGAMDRVDIDDFYRSLCSLLDTQLGQAADKIGDDMDEGEIGSLAMELAVSAYAQQLLCKRLIQMLPGREPEERDRKKRKD